MDALEAAGGMLVWMTVAGVVIIVVLFVLIKGFQALWAILPYVIIVAIPAAIGTYFGSLVDQREIGVVIGALIGAVIAWRRWLNSDGW
jgi:predicted RND superfamily exporter protein